MMFIVQLLKPTWHLIFTCSIWIEKLYVHHVQLISYIICMFVALASSWIPSDSVCDVNTTNDHRCPERQTMFWLMFCAWVSFFFIFLFLINCLDLSDVACVSSVSSHWERPERKKSSSKGNDQLDTLDQITQKCRWRKDLNTIKLNLCNSVSLNFQIIICKYM
jgi:hypothetical protein